MSPCLITHMPDSDVNITYVVFPAPLPHVVCDRVHSDVEKSKVVVGCLVRYSRNFQAEFKHSSHIG